MTFEYEVEYANPYVVPSGGYKYTWLHFSTITCAHQEDALDAAEHEAQWLSTWHTCTRVLHNGETVYRVGEPL